MVNNKYNVEHLYVKVRPPWNHIAITIDGIGAYR